MIFKQALLTGVLPSEWKKEILFPFTKKSEKHNIKDYRPVSLLPICGEIFERLIFNEMFIFFSFQRNVYFFSPLINSSLKNSPICNLLVLVSTNCYQLPTNFLHVLIIN